MELALAILKAIAVATPALVKLFENFTEWFVAQRVQHMRKEIRDAIRKAITEQDQRDLEEAIGSPTAGKPSGLPGTVIVDHPPPGVQLPNKTAN